MDSIATNLTTPRGMARPPTMALLASEIAASVADKALVLGRRGSAKAHSLHLRYFDLSRHSQGPEDLICRNRLGAYADYGLL